MENLMQFYYTELKSLLTRLQYDMQKFPSLHAFQMQVLKKYFYGEKLNTNQLPKLFLLLYSFHFLFTDFPCDDFQGQRRRF